MSDWYRDTPEARVLLAEETAKLDAAERAYALPFAAVPKSTRRVRARVVRSARRLSIVESDDELRRMVGDDE